MNIIIVFYIAIISIMFGFFGHFIYDHWNEIKEVFKKDNE